MHHFVVILIIITTVCCDLCRLGDRTFVEDEKWVMGNFVMQCLRWGGRRWEARIVACISNRHEIPLGVTKTYGNVRYTCKETESGASLDWNSPSNK
ncbi:unnamed protein product [Cylicocyclus nassatus]|uniref:Abnormal cell migration protein 18-like fibronectin type I domain-containing protein n=1 Tax=Cylicocyclus nassatus TaxID=53992 RepID=A0AA36MD72_CYLNA|nr:unnamed protein product [Cylicocyclus nassatus]